MQLDLTYLKHLPLKKTIWVFMVCFILLVILQDLLEARFQNSAFYLSESILFSSFWWIFIPLLYAQFKIKRPYKCNAIMFNCLLICIPIVLHLLAFPALVWVLSNLFYEYTFRYLQTFQYTISAHLYQLILFYTLPIFSYHFIKRTFQAKVANPPSKAYETTLLVNEGSKRFTIAVADILYFAANSPYINIHLGDKQYLYNESLKTLACTLDTSQFVRVHKSTIVNVNHVQSYVSRLNGDYDLSLKDGTVLRVSRNFATNFKERYRVTVN